MTASWIRSAVAVLACLVLAACSTAPRPPSPGLAHPPASQSDAALYLCPQMTVSNAPPSDSNRKVKAYAPVVRVKGVALAVNPATGACLSSGFGQRGGRMHKGLDFHATLGAPILSAGDGKVLEAVWRDDFGYMLVIDHGHGVYTRYCHLKGFADSIKVGSQVSSGQTIAFMGNTAKTPVAVHLHYEILTGTYETPKLSFGLTAVDPFAYSAA